MGFFTKADPIAKLRSELETRPNDSKLLIELGGLLKAAGNPTEAAASYLRAATALNDLGFGTKAVALIRQVLALNPKSIPAHEALAKRLEEMKMKEDLRPVLKSLFTLYQADGRATDARTIQAQIEALGPGR